MRESKRLKHASCAHASLQRVLIVHNRYQHAGGEDAVVVSELELLRTRGHEVRLYERNNSDVDAMSKALLAVRTVWSHHTIRDLERQFSNFRPDVIHIHNTFPLISPAVYWAADRISVPVVQTIHNFRLLCLQAMFLREGQLCEDCLGRSIWRGVIRKCYRNDYLASATSGVALQVHRLLGTYQRRIRTYIALNQFCRDKLVAGGLPTDRIRIKPNFVAPIPVREGERTGNPLFVGRLSEEKGIKLLGSVAVRHACGIVIDVIGSGPLESSLSGQPGLRMLGARPTERVYEQMRNAPFLIMPSIWYENMPRTLIEAYACGTPVLASRLGALAELVVDGVTGLLFEAGSEMDLSNKLEWAVSHPQEMRAMGQAARKHYDEYYTPEANYKVLMDIYHEAIRVPANAE